MNEERIKEVFSDEAFVKQVLEQDTPEQVQALLAEKEIDFTIEEIVKIREIIEKQVKGELHIEELTDDDLENVSGGTGILIAVGVIVGGLVVGAVVGGGAAAAAEHFTRGRW